MTDVISQVEGKNNSTASTKKPKTKRAAISQCVRLKVIEEFLNSCSKNEAEAIRVIIKYAKGSEMTSLPTDDRAIINDYLNTGYKYYASYVKPDNIREHRLMRTKKIRGTIKQFFDIEKFEKAVDVLYEIALNNGLITEFAKVRESILSLDENTSSTQS